MKKSKWLIACLVWLAGLFLVVNTAVAQSDLTINQAGSQTYSQYITDNDSTQTTQKSNQPNNTNANLIQTQKVNFSPLFVGISDVMTQIKNTNTNDLKDDNIKIAVATLNQLKSSFMALNIDNTHNALKKSVLTAFDNAIKQPNDKTLSQLSGALYTLEKAQNPTSHTNKQAQFAKKMTQSVQKLGQAIDEFAINNDSQKLLLAYNDFNKQWAANERVVRDTSMAHYSHIETSMALLRVRMQSTLIDNQAIKAEFSRLSQAIDSCNTGKDLDTVLQTSVPKNATLTDGIQLLQAGLDALQNKDKNLAQKKLGDFIAMWASIEGDVATKNAKLYADVENQIVLIMAQGEKVEHQKTLQTLIHQLQTINQSAGYTAIDAMLVLLREGLESLLIVVALISALNASGQQRGKKYVYVGVFLGLLASVLGALVLTKVFGVINAGKNRETIEAVVGILAVAMMMGVGAWLHNKSSTAKWNAFIKRHTGNALTTGSAIGFFGLAFVSVFREGAETILFYAGMLPKMALGNFLTGIGVALLILATTAIFVLKYSVKLPIPTLFKCLTVVIYVLGFKMLGVSIWALQLTNHLPRTVLDLPSFALIGFYPSVQGLLAQFCYLALVALIVLFNRPKQPNTI